MTTRYLLHFVQEHVTFRWTEFLAVTSKNNCKFKLITEPGLIETRPFIVVELSDEDKQENILIECAKSCYLLKGLYELWAQAAKSVDHLADLVERTSLQFKSGVYSEPCDQPYRVNVESFNVKVKQSDKIDWIKRMKFLDSFNSKPNLTNPIQTYCIFEMNERSGNNNNTSAKIISKEYYFARHLTQGARNTINSFSLKTRTFIANTSMDPALSLITANAAKIKTNDIVYDPFVGSGSLLLAAAHLGAHVVGSDIDWPLLHGKSRPSRKGQSSRGAEENVRANFKQYQLEKYYLDVLVADITRRSIREKFTFDAIVADPPYGVRESSEKIGIKRNKNSGSKGDENLVRFPTKVNYSISELMVDLYLLAAEHLTIGGRLVYYLPVLKSKTCSYDEYIPRHPGLKLISYCEQGLTINLSRLMVVMEKIANPSEEHRVEIPRIISDNNFREKYFSKPEEPGESR